MPRKNRGPLVDHGSLPANAQIHAQPGQTTREAGRIATDNVIEAVSLDQTVNVSSGLGLRVQVGYHIIHAVSWEPDMCQTRMPDTYLRRGFLVASQLKGGCY